MRLVQLVAAVMLIATPAAAQTQDSSEPMLELARKVRASAEQMKGQLPQADIDEMIRSAEVIEEQAREGAYSAVPVQAVSLEQRIQEAHGGRLEWLATKAACAGFTQENFRTYVSNYNDARRDALCKQAYGHWAEYMRVPPGDNAASGRALAAYDKGSQAALDYFGER
jgi:hypothetical protein